MEWLNQYGFDERTEGMILSVPANERLKLASMLTHQFVKKRLGKLNVKYRCARTPKGYYIDYFLMRL